MAAKRKDYEDLIKPEAPGAIDKTAVNNAAQGVTAAKSTLDSMNYDNFKQGSMYQGLQKDFSHQGQQAMKDTLGQVAARTGGMASSWATSAAQQGYNNYMRQLEDLARSMYNDEYSKARDKVNLAQDEYNRAYGEHRDKVTDAWTKYKAEWDEYKYGDAQYQEELKKEEERIASDAYYGEALGYADYKAAGGTLDEKTYNSIVAAAQGSRGDDTYTRTQQEKKQAQADVIAIWSTGGTPTAEQLEAAGWGDETASASEDGKIPAGLSALGQAYYKQATAAPEEEDTEFRGVSATEFEQYSEYFNSLTTQEDAINARDAILAATGNEDFAFTLYEMWLNNHSEDDKIKLPEIVLPRDPKLEKWRYSAIR